MMQLITKTFNSLAYFALWEIFLISQVYALKGLLYPIDSETREMKSLNGIWNFIKSDENNPTQGLREMWYKNDLSKIKRVLPMPVPASYNDITTDEHIRDHVGTVWYDRTFFIPKSWSENQRVWIRFGSVHYEAFVWINGEKVIEHEIGHLPFEADITDKLKFGERNRVTVLCDNALLSTTVPQGKISELPNDDGVQIFQSYTFDFFNYAGIHRSVYLYTTPLTYIENVKVQTDVVGKFGKIKYEVTTNVNGNKNHLIVVQIRSKEGEIVSNSSIIDSTQGIVHIPDVKLWWPYMMNPNYGYLYTMEVLLHSGEKLIDVYRLKVGVRTLKWNTTSFLINDQPIYFRGFGKHEDSDIRGKGLDLATLQRDFNLLKWIGANAYRTSHYPYSEESMDFADAHGIMIVDECPSVDTEGFTEVLLAKHLQSLEQLIHRDRNHPSVVMWSIANEPRTAQLQADAYFKFVASYTRNLDETRPVTASIAVRSEEDKAAQYLDIVSFNRYNGWYANSGRLDMITNNILNEAIAWNNKHNKPIILSEYGADTVEGFHLLPSYVWTEEYQTQLFSKHFKAFDQLRKKKWFIGEFVWNFADFKTAQSTTRVGGNKKGVFTRNRQPKAVAHLLRKRYHALGNELDKCKLPADLFSYIAGNTVSQRDFAEL